ncbi:hypothetical protein NBRC116602_20250 [Hyphomicrobiales bacterium 4NK60-0047b]|jgi:hypothetical protein
MTVEMSAVSENNVGSYSHKKISKLSMWKTIFLVSTSLIAFACLTMISPLKAAPSETTSLTEYYVKTVSVADSMQKYVRVADAEPGFFNPYGTSVKQKKYKKYKYKKKAKAHNKYKVKAPKYSLGFKNPKGYIKTYNYNGGPNGQYFDDTDKYIIKKKRNRRSKGSGAYRTMCVRIKDGFYWPISFARSKADFRKDRIKCQKSCSGKVRLFYYRNTSDDLASMRDLKGKRYSSLKTAFLYRKKYVKGANCKPKPWSAEAKAVHKKYAILDAEKKRRMHIAQSKRAENLRVAALTSKKKYRRLKAKYARTLNTAVKRARRSKKARYRRKVARIYKRKKVYRPKKYKYKKYSYQYSSW